MENLMEIKDVTKTFTSHQLFFSSTNKKIIAVNNISLKISKGLSLGIVGESGSGKTTLARLIANILKPDKGTIFYKGKDIASMGNEYPLYRKNVQMIFQNPYSSLNPRITVFSLLRDGIDKHITKNKKEIKKICEDLMCQVGMEQEHLFRYPHEFSGGQKQRISIARALSLNPEIIIADEPVSALDVSIQAQILNLMKRLILEHNKTVILISHDLAVVNFLCEYIMIVFKGVVLEHGNNNEIFANPAHPYTKNLLEASVKKNIKKEEFNNIGQCPFVKYCRHFNNKCVDKIKMVKLSDSHFVRCTMFY